MQMRTAVVLVALAMALGLASLRLGDATPLGLTLQLQEQRISLHNDTAYVRRIMRLAKAAEMRNYMRPEVDACDNFFEYACGNWPKINPADTTNTFMDSRETNFFTLLMNTYYQKQLAVLNEGVLQPDELEEQPHPHPDTDVDAKVKRFYASCQRLHAGRRGTYMQQLRTVVAEFGPMPALLPDGAWVEDDFDWLATIARIEHTYGLDIILQVNINEDFHNKSTNKLLVGHPGLKLQTKAMYTSEATRWHRDQYRSEMQRNLQRYLGVEEARAARTAADMLEFEVQLAHAIVDQRQGKTLRSLTQLRTMDELQAAYEPTIDFRRYIHISLGRDYNDTVYEYFADYQRNLVELVQRTPKEHLANYIMYQLLQPFLVDEQATEALHEQQCLELTKDFFAKVLDNMLYRRYDNTATVRDVHLIWAKIKATFGALLASERLEWMSPLTRKLAAEKLNGMRLEINDYEQSNFSAEYATLNISDDDDFVTNVRKMLMLETRRAISELDAAPKAVESPVFLSFSPAYIQTENLIKIPVWLVQPNLLWSDHYPNALKFGTLGVVIAHELVHGFDDRGRKVDAAGVEVDWWDDASTAGFDKRKQCFKRQYARFRYGGEYLPPSDLQAENIADNAAIRLAYSAYADWLAEGVGVDETRETLPHLSYTSRQLFFISYAQFWCNDVDEHFKDKVSLVNVHAPPMFRVIGPLANFEQFAEDFKCASGTTMNPERKCRIY